MTHHLEQDKVWARDRIVVLNFIERFHIDMQETCFFALKVICF